MDKYETLREKNTPTNNVYPNIKAQNIPSSAITASKIASGAVTASKIDNLAVQTAHIANGAVTEDKIDGLAVTTGKIASLAVTNAKIADGAVHGNKIANGGVSYKHLNIKEYDSTYFLSALPTLNDFLDFARLDDAWKNMVLTMEGTNLLGQCVVSFSTNWDYFVISFFDRVSLSWKSSKIDNDSAYTSIATALKLGVRVLG